MMDDSAQEKTFWRELHALVLARENGTLSEAGRQRLEELITSDPSVREVYARYLLQTASLRAWAATLKLSGKTPKQQRAEQGLGTRSPLLGFLDRLPAAIHPARHPVRFFSVAVLMTSVFWIAVVMLILPRGEPHADHRQAGQAGMALRFDARIVYLQDAVWGEEARQPRLGTILPAGQSWELRQGLVQLLFGDGAVVVLEGPAHFQVDSAGAITIERGKLLARAEGRAKGFTVHTPVVQVVDVGTEFGVEVSEEKQETEVQVFEGSVAVSSRGDMPQQYVLKAGEASLFGNSPQQGFYVQEKKMNRMIYASLAAVLALPTVPLAEESAQATLVAHYRLDETAAGNVINQVGPPPGTIVGPPGINQPGQIGTAYSFNGSSQYVTIANVDLAAVASAPFSVSAWINPVSLTGKVGEGAGIVRWITTEAATPGAGEFFLSVNDEGRLVFGNGSVGNRARSLSGVIGTGDWIHVAATWDGVASKLYIDGMPADLASPNVLGPGWGAGGWIGRNYTTEAYHFNGLIDDVGIWTSALSDEQIETIYQYGLNGFDLNGPPPGPDPENGNGAIPEPASGAALGVGGLLLLGLVRRRKR